MSATESANTKFYQFVDTPYHVTYSAYGEAFVDFPPKYLKIDGFRQVSVAVAGTAHTHSFDLRMGKISGATFTDTVAFNQSADKKIHTYNVTGPEMNLVLKGDPNTTDDVALWLYLRS
jgi:hypothetical protein